jgi:hypothetical protein
MAVAGSSATFLHLLPMLRALFGLLVGSGVHVCFPLLSV